MSISVVDLNEEAKEVQDEPVIEETKQEEAEIANETIEEPKEEQPVEKPVEQLKPKAKPKPKPNDIVPCPDCNKNMTFKNLRYSHKCSPEPPPVKKQSKPKAKQAPKPKPVPQPIYEEEQQETQPVIRQRPPPNVNPASALAQHYQLLQQQYIKQKQEKYNNLCQNMFKTKPNKR